MRYLLLLSIFFISLCSSAQIVIRGKVTDKEGRKIQAHINQHGSTIVRDFVGDFTIDINSLGGTYYFRAFGYETEKVVIEDTSYLIITLKKQKSKPKKTLRKMKRDRKKAKRKMVGVGGCCFVEGSNVLMGNGTERHIEGIQIGDTVLTYNFELHKVEKETVSKVDKVEHKNIVEIRFSNHTKIRSTKDHPYYVFGKGICSLDPEKTNENYGIKAAKMEKGDQCYVYGNGKLELISIVSLEKVKGVFTTYNLSGLGESNNYFVNKILVNNEQIRKLISEKLLVKVHE